MGILTPEYIKEQAHKPCFWSEEYGFDVVAFTLAMEQNYSNRVGSKINELKRSQKQLEAENATLRELDVRKIMLAVIPGEDGIVCEVYAKSVEDVEEKLTALALAQEDTASENATLRGELAAAYETAETTARRQLARIEELMGQLAAAKEAITAEYRLRNVWQCAYEECKGDLAAAQKESETALSVMALIYATFPEVKAFITHAAAIAKEKAE